MIKNYLIFFKKLKLLLLLPLFIFNFLNAELIETFYGEVNVEEKVILELIQSPAFQRLKDVHMYGIGYYTTHKEPFSRYSHSLGVFHLLRNSNRPLKEQIAGLLHDASHTVFSHVGDWVFNKLTEDDDYQNSIHEKYLEESGLADILRKYGIEASEVLPLQHLAPALEADRPNASADRLDYSLQGAYHQNFLTKEEASLAFQSLKYENGLWVSSNLELMEKMVRFILFMTEDCFGSINNHLSSRWLADAILRAFEIELIDLIEFHTSIDDLVWEKLITSSDPFIKEKMYKASNPEAFYEIADYFNSDAIIKTKFFGFDPYIQNGESLKRITHLLPELKNEYDFIKEKMSKGFSIKYKKSS
jgi:HD superfamily phosphohydrolase